MNDDRVQPLKHQRLGVDDATVRRLVLEDKRPRRTLIEVLAEVRVRSLRSGDSVGASGKDQLRYCSRLARKVYRVDAKWVVAGLAAMTARTRSGA